MRSSGRQWARPRAHLAAVLLLGAACGRGRPSAPPEPTANPGLAPLIAHLSEPAGSFDTDNLISNESAYLQVAEQLDALPVRGGLYLGVGPEQNYSYIARVRPRWAFILDIRRENLLHHLFFNWIFAVADRPGEYLCHLLSRPCPARLSEAEGASLPEVIAAVERVPPDENTLETGLLSAIAHIEGRLSFPLTPADRGAIRNVARAFFKDQLDLRFETYGQGVQRYHPTYRSLLLARSPGGRFGHFLSSDDDYRLVRDLARSGRVVPVVADFAGPHAIRTIGAFARERHETVSAFYVSNVEYYLFPSAAFARFAANVRELPLTPDSVFIRAYFHYGLPHPAALPGHRSTTLLQRMPLFLAHQAARPYGGYHELAMDEYLR